MLGPEQINLTSRPTPDFFGGLGSIQLTQSAAKDLGLKDGQIIQGVIAARGALLKLIVNNKELEWPAAVALSLVTSSTFVSRAVFLVALWCLIGPQLSQCAQSALPPLPRDYSAFAPSADQPSVLAGLFKLAALMPWRASSAAVSSCAPILLLSMAKLSPQMVKRGLSQFRSLWRAAACRGWLLAPGPGYQTDAAQFAAQ